MLSGKLILTFTNDDNIPDDLIDLKDDEIPMKIYGRDVTAQVVRRKAKNDIEPEYGDRIITNMSVTKTLFEVEFELTEKEEGD